MIECDILETFMPNFFTRNQLPNCPHGDCSSMTFGSILLKLSSLSVLKLKVMEGRLEIILHHFYLALRVDCEGIILTIIILEEVRLYEYCCHHHYPHSDFRQV